MFHYPCWFIVSCIDCYKQTSCPLLQLSRKYDPFKHLDEVVYQDQGPVVQLDCSGENLLLVSLWTRCVMLTVGQRGVEITQVGKKLRWV